MKLWKFVANCSGKAIGMTLVIIFAISNPKVAESYVLMKE